MNLYRNCAPPHEESMGFVVRHYAGEVTYDVNGWAEKNSDKLSPDTYQLLASSSNTDFFAPWFSELMEKKMGGGGVSSTIVGDFTSSLVELQNTLHQCTCNFVRCIKASNPLDKDVFSNALVLQQLKYTGMLDTLRIRRKGFPFRMSHQHFWDEFHVLFPEITSPYILVPNESVSKLYDKDMLQAKITDLAQNEAVRRIREISGNPHEPPEDQIRNPCFMGYDKQFPGPNHAVKEDLGPGGGYATAHMVFLRDWVGTQLKVMADEKYQYYREIGIAAYRGAMQRKKYDRFQAMYNIQTVMRFCNASADFQNKRSLAKRLGPLINASMQRAEYDERYHVKFEAITRQTLAQYMVATARRLQYYKQKDKYMKVVRNIDAMKSKDDDVVGLHKTYIVGQEAKLSKKAQSLAEIQQEARQSKMDKERDHLRNMANLAELSKRVQSDVEVKMVQLKEANRKLDEAKTAFELAETRNTNSALSIALAWQERKTNAETSLSRLQEEPVRIQEAHSAHLDALDAELRDIQFQVGDEKDVMHRKVREIIDHMYDIDNARLLASQAHDKQKKENDYMLKKLTADMSTIDDRHNQEKKDLRAQLVHQNWELAQLRIKEAQAEDQYSTLQRHGALGISGAMTKQQEVDHLAEKLTAGNSTLENKKQQLVRKMELVRAATQAENDAQTAWDLAQQEHNVHVGELNAQLRREQEEARRIEMGVPHDTAPQRPSRFHAARYEEVMRPEYLRSQVPFQAASRFDYNQELAPPPRGLSLEETIRMLR